MRNLAIIICNYNKEQYIIQCIQSVLNSALSNFEIYVVDNASTDNSVNRIKQLFSDKVNLIVNKENLGGSGGFNTGIKEALKSGYKYIMLLDNDVVVNKGAIKASIDYLEKYEEVAIVGSKIYSMDNPSQIQEMGAAIDFDNFTIKPFYKGYTDGNDVLEIVKCDYVPACAAIIRVQVVREIGLFDEENFIYWDDIDFGYRIKKAGYKVIALGNSKVWHKMGVTQKVNTFGTYYFWRNRIKFFKTYCNEQQKIEFSKQIFEELFKGIYMCNYIGKHNSAVTMLNGVLDSINNVYGKANENRILNIEKIELAEKKLLDIIGEKAAVNIFHNSDIEHLKDLVDKIKALDKNIDITIISNEKSISTQFLSNEICVKDSENEINYEDVIIETCHHVLDLDKICDKIIYIDKYFNFIKNEKDKAYIKNYEKEREVFKNVFYPILLNGILN